MGRTLKFYVGIILLLGTIGFFVAMFAMPGDWEIKEGWLTGWSTIVAITGLYIVLFYTPIQWIAYWLKRPWLAYLGSVLAVPVMMVLNNVDFDGYENLADNIQYNMAHLENVWEREGGFYLAASLIGIFFTLAYQGWYRKKA